jgi:hypothetical protein
MAEQLPNKLETLSSNFSTVKTKQNKTNKKNGGKCGSNVNNKENNLYLETQSQR